GDSHDQLRNSDCVMIASGTATLEALLIGVPMVVVYKLSSITYAIASRLVKSKFVSLPNVLTNKMLVPELIQKDANPADIADNVMQVLSSDLEKLADEFNKVHKTLQQNASEKAANIIHEFANE
ncbi:MAG: lipid-A-disaccharide synthase, partial [Gammaproteobacteria bacterium]